MWDEADLNVFASFKFEQGLWPTQVDENKLKGTGLKGTGFSPYIRQQNLRGFSR
jgi:hypothetical protein